MYSLLTTILVKSKTSVTTKIIVKGESTKKIWSDSKKDKNFFFFCYWKAQMLSKLNKIWPTQIVIWFEPLSIHGCVCCTRKSWMSGMISSIHFTPSSRNEWDSEKGAMVVPSLFSLVCIRQTSPAETFRSCDEILALLLWRSATMKE